MEGLANIPAWLFAAFFTGALLSVWFGIAWRNTNKQIATTRARRADPTQEQFLSLMCADVSDEAARFLWRTVLPYLEHWSSALAPHPDDNLHTDLPIDPDDIDVDWPRDWAELNGFHESNLPDWPEGWPATVRNYGRWLDMGPQPSSSPRT